MVEALIMKIGVIVTIIVGIGLIILKFYLQSYISEKAKNLATKKDIADIIKKTEEIRTFYAKQMEEMLQQNRIILEGFRSRNQMKLAALDKRLEVHQKAYTLWRKIVEKVNNKDEVIKVVLKCQKWWDRNSLYLTEEARDALWKSLIAASNYYNFLKDYERKPNEETKKILKDNWEKIMNAGRIITKSVTLPPIDEQLGIKNLDLNNKQKNNS